MADGFGGRSLARKNHKRLALSAKPLNNTTSPSAGDSQIPGAIGNDENRNDTLEIGLEFTFDLRSEDLVVLKELGAGNGGTVSKVMHNATKIVMARKVIHVEAKKEVRKQIVRELHIMHDCNSLHIVSFYGAFLNDSGDVIMCMEYMDCGSLDRISRDFGPVRIDVLGKIAEAILGGLTYLYNVHRIMHRDIKPSNVLINSKGYIKLCDFGVSGELVNSLADTFVGTSTYMAPERIQGGKYSVKSDVWSVGLTLMELAIGRFPFDSNEEAGDARASAGPTGILDLLQQIVHEPAPQLPQSDAFPPSLHALIGKCLLKNPEERPTPQELFEEEPFLQAAKRTPVDLEGWAVSLMEKHNRKSHLAPPLSPSTKNLLRGETPASASSSANDQNHNTITASTASADRPALKPAPAPTPVLTPVSAPAPVPVSATTPSMFNDTGSALPLSASSTSSASQRPSTMHPTHPPRTSSTGAVPITHNSNSHQSQASKNSGGIMVESRPSATSGYGQTTTLPMRPAPPAGPLPQPPHFQRGQSYTSQPNEYGTYNSHQAYQDDRYRESQRKVLPSQTPPPPAKSPAQIQAQEPARIPSPYSYPLPQQPYTSSGGAPTY